MLEGSLLPSVGAEGLKCTKRSDESIDDVVEGNRRKGLTFQLFGEELCRLPHLASFAGAGLMDVKKA